MDKYTVDLDQVLNDFECSELTDTHGLDQQPGRPETKRQPNGAGTYVQNPFKNTNVKHSINNVFHSLNEYLNTDITPKCAPLQQQHSKEEEPLQDESKLEIVGRADAVEVVAEPPQEEKEEEIGNDIVNEQVDAAQENKDALIEISSISDSAAEKTEPSVGTGTGTGGPNDDDPDSDSSIETIDDKADEIDNVIIAEEKTVPVPEQPLANQDIVEVMPVVESDVVAVGFADDIDLDDSELNTYLDELEKEYESQVEDKPEEIEDNNKTDVVVVAVAVAVEDNINNTNAVVELDNKDNIAADSGDKQLGQIESADNVNSQVEESEVVEDTTEKNDDSNASFRPTDLPLVGKEGEDTKSVIDLIGDPGSTPYNNVYVNEELPHGTKPKGEKVENSDTECSTSASPTFSDISSGTTSSCTPSTDTLNDEPVTVTQQPPPSASSNPTPAETNAPENPEEGAAAAVEIFHDAVENVEEVGAGEESDKTPTEAGEPPPLAESDANNQSSWLGKQAPLWIPDADALNCLHCDTKFTVIKRRHHCRACGLVLCSKCCGLKHRLEYMDDIARVCTKCYDILTKDGASSSGSEQNSPKVSQPNPNNPAEYCSTVPPHQQVSGNTTPPSVMVPVGVLKRKGSNKSKSNKSVMFCDGIRPGSDLTSLDNDFGYAAAAAAQAPPPVESKELKKVEESVKSSNRKYPVVDSETKSYIPGGGDGLPPTVTVTKMESDSDDDSSPPPKKHVSYSERSNDSTLVETLRTDQLTFCLQLNLYVHVKIINMDCCINKIAWCFSTEGLINVGQDEIVILLELMDNEATIPKDIFLMINNIYADAVKGAGTSVKEMGLSLHNTSNFLGSKNHAGFVYIRPTFQCLQNVIKPAEPYLIGILIHRWETPWAKLFPLRLVLRLGAEYRYYPSPIISNRYRDSVFVEIGHTIINLLADFRNFSYTLPQIRGLTIHMEDKNTTVTIPVNRYDQAMKSMNNSSDHILAFAGNFSNLADSHLVCIQDTQSNENAYSTHAINIHNKPRKVTGASFIVFNGALKSSSGLTAKSSIVEDGLMIQIPSEQMTQVRDSLRNMKDHTIQCGCINAVSDETVKIVWGDADVNFNINVMSPIDNQSMAGIPSIRVHNGKDYVCNSGNRLIRWTEVFIIQNSDESCRNQDPVDISKVSESIAKATCNALVKYLDLLVSNNFYKIGIRTTLHVENVSYSAGSNAMKLPPIYMKSLDNELIPVLHRITSNNFSENAIILELIFRILNK